MTPIIKSLAIAGILAASSALTPAAFAAKTDITIGAQLEPPNLDPSSGAAGAIDQVTYSNIFEGLTRFASDGSIIPGLGRILDDFRRRQGLHLQTAQGRAVP